MLSLCLTVDDLGKALSFPWSRVDQELWELIPDVQTLEIWLFKEAETRDVLVRVIRQSMTHFRGAGRLKLTLCSPSYSPRHRQG